LQTNLSKRNLEKVKKKKELSEENSQLIQQLLGAIGEKVSVVHITLTILRASTLTVLVGTVENKENLIDNNIETNTNFWGYSELEIDFGRPVLITGYRMNEYSSTSGMRFYYFDTHGTVSEMVGEENLDKDHAWEEWKLFNKPFITEKLKMFNNGSSASRICELELR